MNDFNAIDILYFVYCFDTEKFPCPSIHHQAIFLFVSILDVFVHIFTLLIHSNLKSDCSVCHVMICSFIYLYVRLFVSFICLSVVQYNSFSYEQYQHHQLRDHQHHQQQHNPH